jgi:hypothetical protein
MAISIDENVLLFLAGAIFIPIIIFMVKLVVDVGIIKSSVASMQKQIDKLDSDSESRISGRGVRR